MNESDAEAQLCDLLARREFQLTAELVLDVYGDELYRFTRTAVGDDFAAAEVYSHACTAVQREVSGFRGDSSFRTWAYGVVRRAHRRYERAAARRPGHRRSRPMLPEGLSARDEALVILRSDRGLSWSDIARVLGERTSRATALKRRYERIQERVQ